MGTGVPCFTKLSETPLKVLTVKNVKLNVQNTFDLDELTLSQLFSMGFDNKFKINLFFGGFGIMQPFPKFTFLFTSRCVCINGEAIYS